MDPWTPRFRVFDVDGPVHVADFGGDPDLPVVVCLHGLGNSHISWRPLAQSLTGSHRVLAVDLPGHGRSPRAERRVGVDASQSVLDAVLQQIGAPAVLVGHSMGASVAVLQAARRPDTVAALVLLAPPMPRRRGQPMSRSLAIQVGLCAWPWLARTALSVQLRRLGPEGFVQRRLDLTCVSPSTVDEATRRSMVELIEVDEHGDSHGAFVEAARSVGLLVARASVYADAIASVRAPGLVVQGAQDGIVSHLGSRQLATLQPGWTTEVLQGVAHSPHLESPNRTADLMTTFLRSLPPMPRSSVGAVESAVSTGTADELVLAPS